MAKAEYSAYLNDKEKMIEVSINDLIEKVGKNSCATVHGRPACYVFDNIVLLKYDNYRLVESDILQTMEKMEVAQKSGASFASILEYCISSTDERGKSTGYIMQERAEGSAVFDYTGESSLQNYRNAIISFAEMPQTHFDKLVKDFIELERLGVSIDVGNSGNFFYDKEKGFTFIDLKGCQGQNYLEDSDSRQALSQEICSIFFNQYYSAKTPVNEFEQVAENTKKLLTKLKTALEKVGVTEQEFRYGAIETKDQFIKIMFVRQRQSLKNDKVSDVSETLIIEDVER